VLFRSTLLQSVETSCVHLKMVLESGLEPDAAEPFNQVLGVEEYRMPGNQVFRLPACDLLRAGELVILGMPTIFLVF